MARWVALEKGGLLSSGAVDIPGSSIALRLTSTTAAVAARNAWTFALLGWPSAALATEMADYRFARLCISLVDRVVNFRMGRGNGSPSEAEARQMRAILSARAA